MEKDWNDAVLKSLTDGLEMLRARELYTGITICVEGASYHCHKAVLCSLSPYFNCMFSCNMRESQSGTVYLPFIDCKTFETLLDFFYSGKDVVTVSNVEDVLHASSFLQIQCLQDRCEKVLWDSLTEANLIRSWQLAKLYNYSDLEESIWTLLMEELPTIANSTESLSLLDVDELVSIVEAEDLEPRSESLVCDVALNWLAADIDLQHEFLVKVFRSLKLSLTSCDYLLSLSTRYPFIEEQEEANNILMEACKYHILPAITGDEQVNSEIEDTIVVIGVIDELYTDADDVEYHGGDVTCFSMSDHRWYRLPPVPYHMVGNSAVCTYGSKMCVSGGYSNLQETAIYNADTNGWKMGGTLNDGRCDHVMVAVGDSLYVFGGNVQSIERCINEDGNYVKVGELQERNACLSAEVVDDNIILFNGYIDDQQTISRSEVQCFNTVTNSLTVMCQAPLIETLTKSIICDEAVLTITEDGLVLKLIQEQDGTYQCQKIASVNMRRCSYIAEFSVVAEKDGKMIIGRNNCFRDGECNPLEDMVVVRCDTGDVLWTVKMPFTVQESRMVRLAITREHLSNAL
jgi:hypothetical protein